MGCWEETCAITGSPIFKGDSAVMVLFKPGAGQMWNEVPIRLMDYLVGIHKGTYDEYGWLEEVEHDDDMETDSRRNTTQIFVRQDAWDAIVESEKDAYPKLEEELEAWQYMLSLRLRREILGAGKKLSDLPTIQPENELKIPVEVVREYLKVQRFCLFCRVDLTRGLAFQGSQTASEKRYDLLLTLMADAAENLKSRNVSEYDS